jgi:hypothetical protein
VKEFSGARARMFQHGRGSVSLLTLRSVAETLRPELIQLPGELAPAENRSPSVAETVVQKVLQ